MKIKPILFKWAGICLIAVAALASCKNKQEPERIPPKQHTVVKILAVNDMHSELGMFGSLAFMVDSIRAICPNVLLLSGGDNRTGNPANDMDPDSNMPMMELMSMVGFDASAVGNHDFDKGTRMMGENIAAASFPFLCANAHPSPELGFDLDPYKVFSFGPAKIGVLSLVQIGKGGIPSCLVTSTAGVSFTNPYDEVAAWHNPLKNSCNAFVLLSHLGLSTDLDVAQKYPDIDVIVGGHSHSVYGDYAGTVLVTQAGSKLSRLSEITLTFQDGKLCSKGYRLHVLQNGKNVNPKVKAVADKYLNRPELQEKIADVNGYMNKRQLGSLVADSFIAGSGADISITNLGGVRLNYFNKSYMTVSDALSIDPFYNQILTYTVTGGQIVKILEDLAGNYPSSAACVGGISYSVKLKENSYGSTVSDVKMLDGSNFDLERNYTLATSSYVASICKYLDLDAGFDEGLQSSYVLLDYVKAVGVITPGPERENIL